MLLQGARFLLAFGISTGSVVTQTVIRDCYSGKALGKLFSTVGAVISLSLAIGPVLGSIGALAGGYQAVFIILGCTALLMSFWAGLSLPETHPGQESVKSIKGSFAGQNDPGPENSGIQCYGGRSQCGAVWLFYPRAFSG